MTRGMKVTTVRPHLDELSSPPLSILWKKFHPLVFNTCTCTLLTMTETHYHQPSVLAGRNIWVPSQATTTGFWHWIPEVRFYAWILLTRHWLGGILGDKMMYNVTPDRHPSLGLKGGNWVASSDLLENTTVLPRKHHCTCTCDTVTISLWPHFGKNNKYKPRAILTETEVLWLYEKSKGEKKNKLLKFSVKVRPEFAHSLSDL